MSDLPTTPAPQTPLEDLIALWVHLKTDKKESARGYRDRIKEVERQIEEYAR